MVAARVLFVGTVDVPALTPITVIPVVPVKDVSARLVTIVIRIVVREWARPSWHSLQLM